MMKQFVDHFPWPLGRELLRLMRVDRPIGTWLLLWPSLWGLTAASAGRPDLKLVGIFAFGTFLMRSAGCVANDLADRNFDPLVERTRDRPLAAGRVTPGVARRLLFVLLGLAFLLVLFLQPLVIQLSLVGAFLAVSYPFTKRFIQLPQFYMGAAFGWGAVMAWAAVADGVPWAAWMLFAATLTWAAGYDTIYALMDIEDDLKIGVKSTAILFGRYVLLAVAVLYVATVLILGGVGHALGLNGFFYLFLSIASLHMAWQLFRIRRGGREVLLAVFLSNKWTGLWILFAFALR
ncbi:MAG: 4-hydroxybenzoate octaprenyltransferase [Magnetococcus sp. DMHC-6]